VLIGKILYKNMYNRQDIEQITLTDLSNCIIDDNYRDYFLSEPGKEHYKLLAYISTKYENETLIDIGTHKGGSALALSFNKKNNIVSFNVEDELQLSNKPKNINFIIDDILDIKYKNLLLTSPFICLDTYHDGTFERLFHKYLQDIKWKGTLLLDDIFLNIQMKEYWAEIQEQKNDLTSIGHCTGTGCVFFK